MLVKRAALVLEAQQAPLSKCLGLPRLVAIIVVLPLLVTTIASATFAFSAPPFFLLEEEARWLDESEDNPTPQHDIKKKGQ